MRRSEFQGRGFTGVAPATFREAGTARRGSSSGEQQRKTHFALSLLAYLTQFVDKAALRHHRNRACRYHSKLLLDAEHGRGRQQGYGLLKGTDPAHCGERLRKRKSPQVVVDRFP